MLVATIAQTSVCFFVQEIGPLAEFFKKDFSLSDSQIGLSSSAAQFLPIIELLVAGELLDKFNERYIVEVGAIGISITLLLDAIADNYISLLVCLLIIKGFYSSAQPGGTKSVSSGIPQSQRGFAMGIRQAGLPLGGIVLPANALVYGIQGAFLVGAIISFLGGCIFIIFYHSPAKGVTIAPESKARASFYANVKSCLAMLTAPHMKNIIFFRRFTCNRSMCFNHFYNDLFL